MSSTLEHSKRRKSFDSQGWMVFNRVFVRLQPDLDRILLLPHPAILGTMEAPIPYRIPAWFRPTRPPQTSRMLTCLHPLACIFSQVPWRIPSESRFLKGLLQAPRVEGEGSVDGGLEGRPQVLVGRGVGMEEWKRMWTISSLFPSLAIGRWRMM